MTTEIVLLNPFHIGDILFGQKTIEAFYAHNPEYNIKVCIERGHFFLSEIPGIQHVYDESYMSWGKEGQRFTYHDGKILINLWLCALTKTTSVMECNYHRMYEGFRPIIDEVNGMYGTQLRLPDASSINPVYTIPHTPIDRFLSWKQSQSGKQNVLYMNYYPQSYQPVPYDSHDHIIVHLSQAYPHINFLIAKASDELKAFISHNSIQNIVDCLEFDCAETTSCENICKLNHIMHECDYTITFDVGACFTYANDKMFNYGHTVLHVACWPQFYNYIADSFPRDAFEAKVRFLLAYTQEDVVRVLVDALGKKRET